MTAEWCRAEKLSDPNDLSAKPGRVAVKRFNLDEPRLCIEGEAEMLKGLSEKAYSVPFHSIHLPPDLLEGLSPAYLVMG